MPFHRPEKHFHQYVLGQVGWFRDEDKVKDSERTSSSILYSQDDSVKPLGCNEAP